jgi:TonB family protein
MRPRWSFLPLCLAACTGGASADAPPVLQGEVAVDFPPELFVQGVTGTTELQLFVDSTGAVIPDSTRILRSSGTPALDSAALAAVPRLRYAPGQKAGRPAAMPFVQPIQFQPRP